MVALARKTLLREWRRFLPAVLAVCFAGLLLVVQAALVLGIFGSAAVYVTASSPDLWVGFPGTQSVNLGRSISGDVEMVLRMDPDVTAVEPFLWVDADWRGPRDVGGVSVFVTGINPRHEGMMFDQIMPVALRPALMEPGSVIVDRADLDQLGVKLGDFARIDGKRVHVIAAISGLRALGGVNVLTSLETARALNNIPHDAGRVTYFVARTRNAALAPAIATRLSGHNAFGRYEVWTAKQFALRSQLYWMLDTGAGIAVLFMAGIVFLVGVVVASQALMAVVIGSAREYATLNALGAGMAALRRVVFEQAAWIGGIGMILGSALSTLLLLLAESRDVPVAMTPMVALICASMIMLLAMFSGLFAMRGLLRADPAMLLR
jgi:putative ABC transport system permease protein